jgi:hypothetical protein
MADVNGNALPDQFVSTRFATFLSPPHGTKFLIFYLPLAKYVQSYAFFKL